MLLLADSGDGSRTSRKRQRRSGRRSRPAARSARSGSRPATTTCTSNRPSVWPTSFCRRCAKDSSSERSPAADPRDHGLGRDRADDGHAAPRDRGAPGRADAARRPARHAVRISGERVRDHRARGRVLRTSRAADDRGRRISRAARAPTRAIAPRSPRPPRSRACARRASSSPVRAAPRTRSRSGASSPVPEALTTKLAEGGAVVFSSAAALTLGRFSVPVYEIYKVGQPVHWLDGLDLMRAAGFEGIVRGHPPLRQRRGRHARHPLLLPRRAAARGDGGDAARRRVGARHRRAHRAGRGPRREDRHRVRARRPDGAPAWPDAGVSRRCAPQP